MVGETAEVAGQTTDEEHTNKTNNGHREGRQCEEASTSVRCPVPPVCRFQALLYVVTTHSPSA